MLGVWGYLKEYEQEKEELQDAINNVLKSGRLILGKHVTDFEKNFAEFCQSKFGVGVNSGTDALFIGLKILGVGPGDEIITVSNTAVPTVSAIVSTGAEARFVDITSDTHLMDVSKLEKAITEKTKAILPVHLYGQCVDMEPLLEIADKYSLSVLEDCAQSHGAKYKGKMAGSFGDLAAFSFYPTKILGAYGDGGIIITSRQEYYEKGRRLRFYGMEKQYYSIEHGYNSRLDELQAAILLKKLSHLNDYVKRRREIAKKYEQELKDTSLILPVEKINNYHAYFIYVVKHKQRDLIIDKLKKKDIFLNISYPWPIHIMEGYQALGFKEGDFPVTEKMAKEIFSIPMYPSLTDEEQLFFIKELKNVLKEIE